VFNAYDSQGRVVSQQDQIGRQTTFVYLGDPTSSTGSTTTVTDPKGNVTVDTYEYGLLTAQTKGSGSSVAATWEYAYDPSTVALVSEIDPNGNTSSFSVDNSGNRLSTTDPRGRVDQATYNAFNEPLTQRDGLGVTTTSSYDANGNLTSVSRPLLGANGQVIATRTTQYNRTDPLHPGDVTSIIDPDNNTWSYAYDAYGDQASAADPVGDQATATYNADGWKLTAVSPRGNVNGCGCASQYTTTTGYVDTISGLTNEFGDAATVTDPLGHVTASHYDADRNLTSATDFNGNTTAHAFDLANQETVVTRADHTTLRTDYNPDGTVLDEKDGKGNATVTFGYNALGRVTTQTDALNNVTTFTYDANGNRLTQQDPGGNCSSSIGCTTTRYDGDNEPISVTYSDGVTPNVSQITYDADGERVGMTDGTGTSSWAWDSLQRLTSFTDGRGDQVQYQYNLRGLISQIAYPGNFAVSRGYDNAGRWTSVQDWLGNSSSFGYDPDGDLTTKTLPPSTAMVDTSVFNAAGQLTSTADVKGGSSTLFGASYGRDGNGQVTSDSSLPAGVGSDQYTALNQLCYAGSSNTSGCTAPPTGSQAYTFDAADNLTTNKGTTQSFNAADELCWSVPGTSTNACATAPTGATRYGYDSRGNRTTVTPATGSVTNLGYDQANRLSSWGQGSTTTATYKYDGDGLRMSKTVSSVTAAFTWDVSGALPMLISDGTSRYVYGPGGLPLEQVAVPPAISLVGTATLSGKSTSVKLTLPTGFSVNDQVVVATTQPSTTTVTTPSGYTLVSSVTSGGTSPLATTTVFRHTVVSGDTAVTLAYSTNTTAQAAALAVYRGVNPTQPIDVTATDRRQLPRP
jgi:YD repeat-containing protein